jgi:hypothetical protein
VDSSDRPEPASVAPQLMALITGNLPSGRYRAADIASATIDEVVA